MSYKAPDSFWEASKNLNFDQPVNPGDPLFIDTTKARGEINFNSLLKPFGVIYPEFQLKILPKKVYSLFCGHRGCGKSTQLRYLKNKLHKEDLFYVVFVDVLQNLDVNNLSYVDILMSLIDELLKSLNELEIKIDQVYLTNLENWFTERIEKQEQTKEFAASITSGGKAEPGLPWLGKLFTEITASIRANSTYKEELRKTIKNSFSQFADAFNKLILAAEEKIVQMGKGQKLLFIVDGTDRLSGVDAHSFFITDAYQLQHIESNFIYCAPIHLLYESTDIRNIFKTFVLPMIKIREKKPDDMILAGYDALRSMVDKRISPALFDSPETVDYLIKYSGGNPRHLIQLLDLTFQHAEHEFFDKKAAESAVKQMATDFKRFLKAEDYKLLFDIDQAEEKSESEFSSEQTRNLLYHLALLEYNSFWWMSHPVIQTLESYKKYHEEK